MTRCEATSWINSSGSPTPLTLYAMSSGQANLSNSSPAGPHYSSFNADPSVAPYTIVPKTRRDGTTGQGRVCEICTKIIGLGANGSLYPFNSHVEACRKKHSMATAKKLDRARSLPVSLATTTTVVPSGIHQSTSTSLSPLLIAEHISGFLSPSPSSTHSPDSPLQLDYSGSGLDGDTPSIPSIPVPFFHDTNPAILINPPSDDLPTPTMALYSPRSHQIPPVTCSGVLVQWTPGTIWETYPFPSHSFVKHPWDIIEFRPPSFLCLRSKACTGVVSAGGHRDICHHCLSVPQCDAYRTIEKRAHSAPPHTSYRLLAFHQLAAIPKTLRKMLDSARLKVFNQMITMRTSCAYVFVEQ